MTETGGGNVERKKQTKKQRVDPDVGRKDKQETELG